MTNIKSLIIGLLWQVYLINCLHVDRIHLSTRQIVAIRSSVKLLLKSDDGDNESQNDELTVESSTKVLSKYETRSKLLEAALMSSRSRESKIDAENIRLKSEISKMTQKISLSEESSLQNILLLETTKSNLYESLKGSSADVARLEKALEMNKIENFSKVTKYRNRLTLLENAYRESQVALEEERDKAEESRIVHEADNKLVSNLRFEIEQLQMDKVDSRMMHEADNKVIAELKYEVEQLQIELEVGRQNLRMQETINAERDKSENQRIVNDQLETNRKEELRVDAENRFRIQNEQNKIERSETFREFYSENIRVKKAQEEQMEREKKNETFLKEQQYLLDETIKLLSAATDGKSREARNAEVDVNLGGQIRLLREQVEALGSITKTISAVSSSLANRIESASELLRDEKLFNGSGINRNEEVSVRLDSAATRTDSGDERASSSSSSSSSAQRTYRPSDDDPRSRVDQEEEREDVEGAISSFFSNIMDNISGADSDEPDSAIANAEKSRKQKIKPGTAQQKRVNLARQSGRALRGMGGAIAKTAADTLGFWVGLGFDEVEIEEEDTSKGRDDKIRRAGREGVDSRGYDESSRIEDYRSSSKIDDIRSSEEDFRNAEYPPRTSSGVTEGSRNLPYSVRDDVYMASLDSIAVDGGATERPLEMLWSGPDSVYAAGMIEETEDFRFLTSDDDQINYNELD